MAKKIRKRNVPPPGIELGFHRPQRCVLTIILRWHFFLVFLRNIYIHGFNCISKIISGVFQKICSLQKCSGSIKKANISLTYLKVKVANISIIQSVLPCRIQDNTWYILHNVVFVPPTLGLLELHSPTLLCAKDEQFNNNSSV